VKSKYFMYYITFVYLCGSFEIIFSCFCTHILSTKDDTVYHWVNGNLLNAKCEEHRILNEVFCVMNGKGC